MAKETKAYKVKHRDDAGYITVEKDGVDVVVHPSTKKNSMVDNNSSGYPDYIMIPKDDDYWNRNIHSTRCGCKKCRSMFADILSLAKKQGMAITLTTDGDKDEKKG